MLWVRNTECTIKSLIKTHCYIYKQKLFSHASHLQLCYLAQSSLTHIFTTHKEKKPQNCNNFMNYSFLEVRYFMRTFFFPLFVISDNYNQYFLEWPEYILLIFRFGFHINDWTKALASNAHLDITCKIQVIGKKP